MLEVLFCGLKASPVAGRPLWISKLHFFKSKKYKFFPNYKFFSIKTLDLELDPDSQLEKCWIRIRIKSMRIRNPA